MIYYWLHILFLYIGSRFFWKSVDLAGDLTRVRRVKVLDCDAMRYMANSKYFYYMDFIRIEILFRTKLYDNTYKKGIYPVLGSQKFIYRKPLKRWSKFSVTLVLEGWDDKWVYHKQVFKQKGEICGIGYTKVAFWKNRKALDIRKIIFDSGIERKEMNPSPEVLGIFENDYHMLKSE